MEFKRSIGVCLNKQEGKVKEMSASVLFFFPSGWEDDEAGLTDG